MAELDVRVRILGRLIGRMSIADQSLEQIRRAQEAPLPHTLLTDLLLGGPRKDVATGTAPHPVPRAPSRSGPTVRAAPPAPCRS